MIGFQLTLPRQFAANRSTANHRAMEDLEDMIAFNVTALT
jgi:hypothetical protein